MPAHEPLSLDQLIGIEPLLSDEEKMIRNTVRRFVRERYLPRAAELFEEEKFPTDLIPEIAAMGLLGATLVGYGCAGVSEPDSGSDPGSMKTRARADGDDFVLSGTKMWITSAPIADLAVVWA